MPTPKLLRYTLRNALGYYYYVDQSGNVSVSPTTKYLTYSPVDWDKTEVKMGRNGKHFGVFRNVILPITFCKDGARIIRHIAFMQSVDAYCRYGIYRRNDNDYLYNLVSEGEIDFSQVVNEDYTVRVKAVENGLAAMVEAGENKVVEVNLDTDPDAKSIRYDGVKLQSEYKWVIPESLDLNGNPVYKQAFQFLDLYKISEETYYSLGEARDTDAGGNQNDVVFVSTYTHSGTIALNFGLKLQNNSGTNMQYLLRLEVMNSNGSMVSGYPVQVYLSPTCNAGNELTIPNISTTANYTLHDGQFMRLTVTYIVAGTSTLIPPTQLSGTAPKYQIINADGFCTMKSSFVMPSTAGQAIRFIDMFKRVISSISGNAATGSSTYLASPSMIDFSNYPYNTFVTSGAALRGLAGAKIKTTLADLLQTAKAVWGLSFGIEGMVGRLEKPSYFLNSATTIFEATHISKFKATIANEHRYNLINVGYPDQNYDEINGRQEVNSEQQWTTGIKNSTNTLDLISKYRADAFGIEYVRSRQFVGVGTSKANKYATENSDDSADNDIFLVHCFSQANNANEFVLYRGWVAVSGFVVANGTMFNLTLTPHRNLCRNLQLIRSGLADATTQLSFLSGKKNVSVSVTDNEVVTEQQNQLLASITRLFRYLVYEVEAPIPNNLLTLMSSNTKYGKIIFTDDRGNVLSGFPIDIATTPGTGVAKTIKLLAIASEDITKQSFAS